MRNFLIKNSTHSPIELCKSKPITVCVLAGRTQVLNMTAVSSWHGHSDIGSFVIYKNHDVLDFKCWGSFSLTLKQDNDFTTFEIVEKTPASD